MPKAWRIVKERHLATAFSGEGAAKMGGRWNSRGVAVVYTSASFALAALETLVHLTPPVTIQFKVVPVEYDDKWVHHLPEPLPHDWRAEPVPPSTKTIGDTWIKTGASLLLAIPSVIIPEEFNLLINPTHPDFKKLQFGKPQDFSFDPRLLQ